MTINAYIFPGIEAIRLSCLQIRDISLISDSTQRYYIPIALTVDSVNKEVLDSNKTQVPLSRREVDIATSPGQEYSNDSGENYISDRKPYSPTDSKISSNREPSLNKHELIETGQDNREGEGLRESEYDNNGDKDEYDDNREEGEYDNGSKDEHDNDGDEDIYSGGAKISNPDLVPLTDLHQSRNHLTQATESRDSTHPHEAHFDWDMTLEINNLEVSSAAVSRLY